MLVDEAGLIFDEYLAYANAFTGQPGVGDRFAQWLWSVQADTVFARKVRITPNDEREFAEFPDDPDLETFDRSDRKFVAVAIASATCPPILNATDTDWSDHRDVLARYHVSVTFLCPELMERDG